MHIVPNLFEICEVYTEFVSLEKKENGPISITENWYKYFQYC